MRFRVRSSFKDVLTLIVLEAVLIVKENNMNFKAEWGYRKLNRLTIERPDWVSDVDKSGSQEEETVSARVEELKLMRSRKKVKEMAAGPEGGKLLEG